MALQTRLDPESPPTSISTLRLILVVQCLITVSYYSQLCFQHVGKLAWLPATPNKSTQDWGL